MSKCRRDKIIPHGLSVYVEPWIGNQDEAFLGTWHKSFGWLNIAKFNKVISCVQWNNYFDSTKYLYIQQNIYIFNEIIIYIFKKIIILIQWIICIFHELFTYSMKELF